MNSQEKKSLLQKSTEYCMLEIVRISGDIYRLECFRAILDLELQRYQTELEIEKEKGE